MSKVQDLNWHILKTGYVKILFNLPDNHVSNGLIPCPLHSDNTASLSVNTIEPIWNCFGCTDGKGGYIDFYMQLNNCELKTAFDDLSAATGFDNTDYREIVYNRPAPPPVEKKPFIKAGYALSCFDELRNNDKACQHLFNKRGITYESVLNGMIGYDRNHPLYGRVYIFPVIGIDGRIKGLEYRPVALDTPFDDGMKLKKELGTQSEFSYLIYNEADTLVIGEGFLDTYCLLQAFLVKNKVDKITDMDIVTPSCGLSTIPKLLSQVVDNYNNFIICIDNDDTENNNKIRDSIKTVLGGRKYNFLKLDIKTDFNDYYKANMMSSCVLKGGFYFVDNGLML